MRRICLVRVVFDNEQVIVKRYRVKANQQSVPTSVITSHAYLSIDVTNDIQYNNAYSPSHWMFQPADELVTSKILDSFNKYDISVFLVRGAQKFWQLCLRAQYFKPFTESMSPVLTSTKKIASNPPKSPILQ